MAGVLLATKYWFLPRIDHWRPDIEMALTKTLGTPVKIRQLQAEWAGLTPSLEITGLSIEDDQGHESLVVPRIDAMLSWRTLTSLEPRFRYIGINELALAVLREKNGQLKVAGFSINQDDDKADQPGNDKPWFDQEPMRWLLSQGQLSLNNATLLWIDEQRGAPPLQLENVSLSLRNRLLSHRFEGRFDVASSPGQQVEFVLHSDRLKVGLSQMIGNAVDGELYLALSNVDPQSLATWVDLPTVSGRYAARAWLDLSQGRLGNMTIDVAAVGAGMPKVSAEQTGWLADQINLRVTGPVGMVLSKPEFEPYVSFIDTGKSINQVPPAILRLQGQRLTLMPPDDVMGTLTLDKLVARAGMRQTSQGDIALNIQELSAVTPDGSLAVKGRWQKAHNDALGSIDLNGSLSGFELKQLYRYLPRTVGTDVLDWMKTAFTAGTVPQAAWVARGPVESFPYATAEEGVFTIDGTVKNWAVDYAPPEKEGALGWPAVYNVDGTLSLNRDILSVTAQNAALSVTKDVSVSVRRIAATLHKLYSEPVLEIRAATAADAQSYHAALTKTALAEVVPSLVNDLQGEGQWTLGLDLSVPLEDVENADFKAVLDLNGGALRYATLPPLEQVTGKAVFTNAGFRTDGITAQVLGSELKATGEFGESGQSLNIQGGVNLLALNEHFKVPALNQWVKGVLPFEVVVSQPKTDGPYEIRADSDLTGVQLAFPAPLVNASGTVLKSQFIWEFDPAKNSAGQGSLRIGNLLHVRAAGRDSQTGSVLSSVAIGVGAEPKPVADGLTVNIATRRLSASAWQAVFDRVMSEIGETDANARPVMPELASVSLTSSELQYDDRILNDVVVSLQNKKDTYMAQFNARQTSGTASWQMHRGEMVGSLNVRLSRLVLGDSEEESQEPAKAEPAKTKTKLPDPKTLSTIPPLDLVIEELVLNGVKLGKLQLVGENDSDNLRWNVEKLTVSNKNVQVSATGQWTFEYKNPGVRINADMTVTDLGQALTALGVRDQVRNGRGTIKAQLDWQRFPWETDFAGLSGKIQVDLTEGIFVNINSGSARVLELLSLQSFGRLLDMNINRGETFRNGFPWSTIVGNLEITKGDLQTEDLVINSPVARIAFHGGASLTAETLNMRATVRPNLDLSGTAMATGFLLNPLVGLSALVGNYILRNPIESILSLRYEVTGPWADPKLNEVGAVQEPAAGSTPAAPAPDASSATSVNGAANNRAPSAGSAPEKTTTAPEQREVYRIELGKDSGFNPDARPTAPSR